MIQDLFLQIKSYYDDVIVLMPKLGIALLVVAVFLLIASFLRRQLQRLIKKNADDPLLVQFIAGILRGTNIVLAGMLFLVLIGQKGIAGSVLGAAGVSAIVIGFAFKDIAENFLAGVILAFNRPFRMGDTIQSGDVEGNIIAMNLRDIQVKTFDGKDVFVPNAMILKNPLQNYTIDGFLRKSFTIGLDYGTDITEARKVMLAAVEQVEGILTEEKMPQTLISELATSTINVSVQYWLDTFDKSYSGAEIHTKAIQKVLTALMDAGINMPGDIIELTNYSGRPLQSEVLPSSEGKTK